MKKIVRLAQLNVVPLLWLVLIVESASEDRRAKPVHWLALPMAIVFAYATLTFTLTLGRLRTSPLWLALSLIALAASTAYDCFDRGDSGAASADGVANMLLVVTYLVWLAAFGAAVSSQWLTRRVPWPLTGNLGVAVVHVLMIAPLVVLMAAFIGSLAAGG